MKYACMSCDTRYDIPDDKIAAKEPDGLRIRCRTCRAIMVVSFSRRLDDDDLDDVTEPALVRRRRPIPRSNHSVRPAATPMAAQADGGAVAASVFDVPDLTGIHASAHGMADSLGRPASTNDAGELVPNEGIFRSLTGVDLKAMPARNTVSRQDRAMWFAALGGKPRGPYTATEMKRLADDGRVRGSTLVWSPTLGEWSQVRSATHEKRELSWLRDVVIARKQRERLTQDRAQQMHGITRLNLDDQPLRSSPPPPLPLDDESTDSEFVADNIFGPTQLGQLSTTTSAAAPARSEFPLGLLIAVGLLTGALAAGGIFYALSTFGLYALPLTQ